MRPSPKHLSLDNQNHKQFGNAISRCQGWTPNCVRTGACELDNDCFHDEVSYRRESIKKIQSLYDECSPLVRMCLARAVDTILNEIEIERKRP